MGVIKPSLPKGTRDFLPEQMFRRQFVLETVRETFERYGYAPLETPSIEKLSVLSGKYGDEGENLIFKVLRRGTGLEKLLRDESEFVVNDFGQLVDEALRYDLTVPLSRVIAMHQNELTFPFKRYQIQPVWRADRPQRGRYREFYQCDIDTVGTPSMLADAEAASIVFEVLSTLGFQNFKLKLNNRKLLNGLLNACEIAGSQATSVFIAIDKMDKIGLDGVRNELKASELSSTQIQTLLGTLEIEGDPESVLVKLTDDFGDRDPQLLTGVQELQEMTACMLELGVPIDAFSIDLHLVRGLGYYTGPIHESVITEPNIGSLTGGGRYDRLIGMFLGRDIPACGTAFGIERIIDVMSQLDLFPKQTNGTQVLVTAFEPSTRAASLSFAGELRKAGLRVETYFEVCKLKKQFTYAHKKHIPFVATIGPDEASRGVASFKDMETGEQIVADPMGVVQRMVEKQGVGSS